jgi:mannose-6-phosphate isomerase
MVVGGDQAGRAMGLPSGKDEAWVVLSAEEEATIGVGLTEPVGPEELRAAALDGRVEQMLDWRQPVAPQWLHGPGLQR